ncbi:helix-turn-helix domain-containing protein [Streptomyces uncialis]|uniref:DNA-binding protein n=1 Tax=Streptomyces uncialis TaxID=1048205 RepID=A0A1Q4VD28_9ACTN|nr:helix-turn-helix transcriptional regulator [Streptomyces uncialis]OKH95763.1 DNA-binding protein [Streptomyces uncialis]
MPPREQPTARQVRLGIELRKLREASGRTAREASALLSVAQPKMSQIESGRTGVSEERVRRLASFYQCDDGQLVDALCGMTREHRGQFWFDEYRGILHPSFLDVAELEWHARALQSLHSLTLPGLLQTGQYARTLFESVWPRLLSDELEARVEHRLRRALILDREDPPPFLAIIHEAALRMRFGGRFVVRDQLLHLLKMSEHPAVSVRVVPYSCEDFIEVTQPVLYASGPVSQLDTVQADSPIGTHLLDAEFELKKCRALMRIAEHASLDADQSRQLIRDIAREL